MDVVILLEQEKEELNSDIQTQQNQNTQLTRRINDSEHQIKSLSTTLNDLNHKQLKAIEDMKLHFEKSLKSALDEQKADITEIQR